MTAPAWRQSDQIPPACPVCGAETRAAGQKTSPKAPDWYCTNPACRTAEGYVTAGWLRRPKAAPAPGTRAATPAQDPWARRELAMARATGIATALMRGAFGEAAIDQRAWVALAATLFIDVMRSGGSAAAAAPKPKPKPAPPPAPPPPQDPATYAERPAALTEQDDDLPF
jgi:hypothetical protein